MQMTIVEQTQSIPLENINWVVIAIFIFSLWCLTIWRLDCRINEIKGFKEIVMMQRGLIRKLKRSY